MGSNPDTTPALPPPPGVTPNFVDPDSIQPAIIAGLSICLGVSTLTGILRLYAQVSLFKRLVWADAWMILGWVFQVGFVAFLFACLPYGAGRHQWNVTQTNNTKIGFFLFIDFILYDVAILGPKVAILLQLKNIFAPHNVRNRFYWLSLLLVGVNIIFYIALSFALIFQCQPIAKGWDSNISGKCLNQNAMLESSGPFNIASDFLIFILPITAVWGLQLPLRKRVAVGSAFAVGLFGCICSAVRLYYSNQLSSSGDATVLVFQNQLWANAEIAIGLLISNIIILPRLIRQVGGVDETSVDKEYGSHLHPSNSRTLRNTSKSYPTGFPPNAQQFEPYLRLNDPHSLGGLESPKSTSDFEFPIHKNTSDDESDHTRHDHTRHDHTRHDHTRHDHTRHVPMGAIERTVQIQATHEPAQAHLRYPTEYYEMGVAK